MHHVEFEFEKLPDGKLTQASREIWGDQFSKLPPGKWKNQIHPAKAGYTKTRYKYYFDCVMWAILEQAGQFYLMTDPNTGDQRRPANTEELHAIMRWIYNPVFVQVGRAMVPMGGSTTMLSDTEFMGKFMDQVIADHTQAPYLVEILDRETWRVMHDRDEWRDYKKAKEGEHPA